MLSLIEIQRLCDESQARVERQRQAKPLNLFWLPILIVGILSIPLVIVLVQNG